MDHNDQWCTRQIPAVIVAVTIKRMRNTKVSSCFVAEAKAKLAQFSPTRKTMCNVSRRRP